MKYASLLSSAFSGSTLLSILLCHHPRLIGFGDTYSVFYVADAEGIDCTCGVSIAACPARREINRKMAQRGFTGFDLSTARPYPLRLALGRRREHNSAGSGRRAAASRVLTRSTGFNTREWINILGPSNVVHLYRLLPARLRRLLFRSFYAETAAFTGVLSELGPYDVYLDGSKSLPRFEILRTADTDMRLIHLVKDPRSYVYSCLARYKRGAHHYPLYLRWLKHNQFIQGYRDRFGPDRYRIVRYEDLVADTEGTVASILEFLDLPPAPGISTDLKLEALHINGNPMIRRFAGIEDRSAHWRSQLDPGIRDALTRKMARHDWIRALYPD